VLEFCCSHEVLTMFPSNPNGFATCSSSFQCVPQHVSQHIFFNSLYIVYYDPLKDLAKFGYNGSYRMSKYDNFNHFPPIS